MISDLEEKLIVEILFVEAQLAAQRGEQGINLKKVLAGLATTLSIAFTLEEHDRVIAQATQRIKYG